MIDVLISIEMKFEQKTNTFIQGFEGGSTCDIFKFPSSLLRSKF